MLKIIRKKHVAKTVLYIITFFIIISFAISGYVLKLGMSKEDMAGKIYGKPIDHVQFRKAHDEIQIHYMLQYGENFEKVRNMINMDQETWNRLIMLYNAKKIKVSDQEVVEYIQKLPFFQRDNKFDNELYTIILTKVMGIQPNLFEKMIRNNIKISKLVDSHINPGIISEQEVFGLYQRKNEKVQISYALITPEQFKKETSITEDEINRYYEKYKLEFVMPPTINVSYINIPFDAQDLTKNDAARTKAYEIYQELQKIKDIDKTAQQFKMQASTTPFFSMEKADLSLGWTYELLQQLFELNQGDTIAPFETTKGIQILQVKERKDAYIPELKDIKDKVKDAVLLNNAKDIAQKKAEEYLEKIKTEQGLTKLDDFAKIAKSLGLDIAQTPLFNREEYLPKIGLSKNFQEAAFNLNQDNKISPVTKISLGYAILHLDNYQPADKVEFEKNKESINKELRQEKYSQAFNEFITELRTQARLEDFISQKKQPNKAM
ncbi:MAG: peptidyl-prolyl cis-trans isomerase [Candidatus Omnitrophica bacterium]|nr:peptidyl-prolyl cis-trans isomerase [Candidatus Omnitrophota bacterium]